MTASAAPPLAGAPCPTCSYPQITVGDAVPWCAACGWNLDRHDFGRRARDFGWRWTDRRAFRTAYQLNSEQYAALVGQPVSRPALGPAGWFTMAIGLAVAAFIVAAAATGVWLCTLRFPGLGLLPGIGLIALAIVLLPRFGRVDRHAYAVTREQAPTLWRLVDEVADAVGTKRPDTLVVDQDYNAYVRGYGLRRRRVVGLGVPLWGSLGPQERVAVLGHEFGHFVNGDVRRGPVTGLAFSSFATMSRIFRPRRYHGRGTSIEWFVELADKIVMGTLSALMRLVQLGVVMIGLRGIQRAEYYADDIAARTAGTDAAVRLLDTLTNGKTHTMLVKQAARQRRPVGEWQRMTLDTEAGLRSTLLARRQVTHREEAAIFASHPPTGMRAALVQSRPPHTARVVLSVADSARIDEELAVPYTRYMKDVG